MPSQAPSTQKWPFRPPNQASPGGEAAIRRTIIIGAVGGLAACALALAGVTAAVTPRDADVADNQIGAGHLSVQVNRGRGSDLNFSNLMPGERRGGDQLVSALMAGVGTADLTLQLTAPHSGDPTDWTSLTVYYGDPEPAAAAAFSGDTCTPAGGYSHHTDYPALTDLSSTHSLNLGALTPDRDAVCVRFVMTMDSQAGNDVQGAAVSVDLSYVLEQTSAASP
jgi:hypothetical protein